MDAARNTAISSEIKRILTEVLRKVGTLIEIGLQTHFRNSLTYFFKQVTDELFDEIATKVIDEDEAIQKGLFCPQDLGLCY